MHIILRENIANPMPHFELINQDDPSNRISIENVFDKNTGAFVQTLMFGQPSLGLKIYFKKHMKLDKHKRVKSDARSFQID